MDMNDNPPKFEQSSYSCSLSQHAVRGQFVTVVSASDPDYIDADNLMYAIAEGNELQTYSIDPISGIITLVNMQNFAENHSTILNVSVTDSVYTSFIRVQINILPANLHNPVFSHLVHEVKINENQMAGRLVITVSANIVFRLLFFLPLSFIDKIVSAFYARVHLLLEHISGLIFAILSFPLFFNVYLFSVLNYQNYRQMYPNQLL